LSDERKVALVTGGAKRVGRAVTLELARAGFEVAVHYRNSEGSAQELAANLLASGRRAIAVQADLADPDSCFSLVEKTVESLGALDVLVNNASVFFTTTPDTVQEFNPAVWEDMFRIHMLAPMALIHHSRTHLERSGRGVVVNLCDISAERPWPDHLAYCATKAGLVSLTRGMARALAPRIRVNGVAPGIAVFPDEYSAALRLQITRQVPLAREGSPDGVARLVRFLVETGDYITGQIVAIDGGRSVV